MSVREKLTAIADAIRSARGAASTEKYSIDEMPEKISEAVDSAFDGGWYDGHQQGINEGIDAGKKSQHDEFWDSFQDKGKRTNYSYAFNGVPNGASGGWNDITYDPKYNMFPEYPPYMFQNSQISDIYKDGKITIDFSRANNLNYTFANCGYLLQLGVIDTRNSSSLSCTFYLCGKLHTIEKLILKTDGSQTFGSAFYYASKLKNLAIEGVIGRNIEFAQCKELTYSSLTSIKNALKDYSGTSTTRTLKLHADAKAKLSESDIAEITQKGWTVA